MSKKTKSKRPRRLFEVEINTIFYIAADSVAEATSRLGDFAGDHIDAIIDDNSGEIMVAEIYALDEIHSSWDELNIPYNTVVTTKRFFEDNKEYHHWLIIKEEYERLAAIYGS